MRGFLLAFAALALGASGVAYAKKATKKLVVADGGWDGLVAPSSTWTLYPTLVAPDDPAWRVITGTVKDVHTVGDSQVARLHWDTTGAAASGSAEGAMIAVNARGVYLQSEDEGEFERRLRKAADIPHSPAETRGKDGRFVRFDGDGGVCVGWAHVGKEPCDDVCYGETCYHPARGITALRGQDSPDIGTDYESDHPACFAPGAVVGDRRASARHVHVCSVARCAAFEVATGRWSVDDAGAAQATRDSREDDEAWTQREGEAVIEVCDRRTGACTMIDEPAGGVYTAEYDAATKTLAVASPRRDDAGASWNITVEARSTAGKVLGTKVFETRGHVWLRFTGARLAMTTEDCAMTDCTVTTLHDPKQLELIATVGGDRPIAVTRVSPAKGSVWAFGDANAAMVVLQDVKSGKVKKRIDLRGNVVPGGRGMAGPWLVGKELVVMMGALNDPAVPTRGGAIVISTAGKVVRAAPAAPCRDPAAIAAESAGE